MPLGATWGGGGVNFAIYSHHATAVTLCFFDSAAPARQTAALELTARTGDVWHSRVPGLRPGQLYSYRVEGPYAPREGHRFNPAKLLVDPYARALAGPLVWNDAILGFPADRPEDDAAHDPRDSAPFVPKSVVVDPRFDWEDDRPPNVPWDRTVIYECHVKGLTRLHARIPEHRRGKYLGMTAAPILDHLRRLGITAVELMPVHHSTTERHLARTGLVNYWGYNTLGFFAPDSRFASGDRGEQIVEFKQMVKAFHRAGIEVILDAVYNHTAEGDHTGPTLCFRGLDNRMYYRLDPNDLRRDLNFCGCGNTLSVIHPPGAQLVLDSLRYWVQEMHVDGFRFDLATTLIRSENGIDPHMAFFRSLRQDPVLHQVKWIVEPWDATSEGYQLGRFPAEVREWNDRYRDGVRRFWRGDGGQAASLASRLSGSSDCFDGARGPLASVNFVTCHDGFTLHDWASYEQRHNDANDEENRDGASENHSRNWGVEGPTDDESVRAVRGRIKRSLLATLTFSQGVPMLNAGDELGRTQRGNNNSYCQDNELSWMDWKMVPEHEDLLRFTCRVLELRRRFPHLRREQFFTGRSSDGWPKDVTWLRPDAGKLTDHDWSDSNRRELGVLLADPSASNRGGRESLLLLMNAAESDCVFVLPRLVRSISWTPLLDTHGADNSPIDADRLTVRAHSLRLLLGRESEEHG